MKKIVITFMILTLFSCHSQQKDNGRFITKQKNVSHLYNQLNNKDMEKFDIKAFNKNMKYDDAGEPTYNNSYTLSDGKIIDEFILDDGYGRFIISSNSLFKAYMEYDENGIIKLKGQYFKNGDFRLGIWHEYDQTGKTINTIDYDKPFVYTFEDIANYCEKNNIPFSDIVLRNFNDEKTKECYWEIQYDGTYENKTGQITIRIDGKTGEIIFVKRLSGFTSLPDGTGKIGVYETLYENSQENKNHVIYKNYQGKDYTQEEWKAFEQKMWEEHQKKNRK